MEWAPITVVPPKDPLLLVSTEARGLPPVRQGRLLRVRCRPLIRLRTRLEVPPMLVTIDMTNPGLRPSILTYELRQVVEPLATSELNFTERSTTVVASLVISLLPVHPGLLNSLFTLSPRCLGATAERATLRSTAEQHLTLLWQALLGELLTPNRVPTGSIITLPEGEQQVLPLCPLVCTG